MDKDIIRKIIREQVYLVMQEMGEEDPMQLSQDMIKSDEEAIKELEIELKWKERDTRVSGLPKDEKDSRAAFAKVVKDRLEMKKKELEMSKQSEINAVVFSQMKDNMAAQQGTQSQIEPQV